MDRVAPIVPLDQVPYPARKEADDYVSGELGWVDYQAVDAAEDPVVSGTYAIRFRVRNHTDFAIVVRHLGGRLYDVIDELELFDESDWPPKVGSPRFF